MTRTYRGLSALAPRLLVFLLLAAVASAQTPHHPLTVHVTLSRELGNQAVSGRAIVALSPTAPRGAALDPGQVLSGPDAVWVAAQEVAHLAPGESADISGDTLAFPGPLSKAPAGHWWAMLLLDVDHNAAYHFFSAGDLRSDVVELKDFDPGSGKPLELTLSSRVPEPTQPKLPANAEGLDFVSPSLSAFWGRPIHMRGVVVLPPHYAGGTTRYPTVYWTHGFGGDELGIERGAAPMYSQLLTSGRVPPMIYVLLDESSATGTHEFADSANNGPWGKALTEELIPYIDHHYRTRATAQARFVTGHSSGGWAALWLGVTYPRIFGGTWPTAPDPSDFHAFTGPDLRARPAPNLYRKPDGSPWMLVRIEGKDVESLENLARQEQVLGEYGGQMASFEWVFSPRAADGRPQQLFDRVTGELNTAVADAWEKYDVAETIRKNAATLRPLLQDHIHLYVGTIDTFHLDEPARLLEKTLQEAGIRAQFHYVEGKDHFNLYQDGLAQKIAAEMDTASRPKTTRK